MKLGEKIRRLRAMHDLTQTELARKASVTQAYVARIESEKVANPKAVGVAALARVLGVPLEVLLDQNLSIESWQSETSTIKMDNAGRELIKNYRSLGLKQKQLLVEFARLLHHQEQSH